MHRRAERLRQEQRGGRHPLGIRRAVGKDDARLEHAGRHLRRHAAEEEPVLLRGHAHLRQLHAHVFRPRIRRGRLHPPPLPQRRKRVPHQQTALPHEGHRRQAARRRSRQGGVLHHRAGQDRADHERQAGGQALHLRGSHGHHRLQIAQAGHRAAPRQFVHQPQHLSAEDGRGRAYAHAPCAPGGKDEEVQGAVRTAQTQRNQPLHIQARQRRIGARVHRQRPLPHSERDRREPQRGGGHGRKVRRKPPPHRPKRRTFAKAERKDPRIHRRNAEKGGRRQRHPRPHHLLRAAEGRRGEGGRGGRRAVGSHRRRAHSGAKFRRRLRKKDPRRAKGERNALGRNRRSQRKTLRVRGALRRVAKEHRRHHRKPLGDPPEHRHPLRQKGGGGGAHRRNRRRRRVAQGRNRGG